MAYAEHRVAADIEVWRSEGAPGEQRILPDGCLDLLVDGHELVVAGPDSAARLHAGRGPALLGVPADELRDRSVPLAQLWGDGRARALRSRLGDDPVRGLAAWARGAEVDPFGLRLRALLGAGRSVDQAAEALGYSPRQLRRRALPAFGYGPQHLGRVLRLVRAVASSDDGLAWADVAARSGYADQAHLARDVRALTGTTPTALRDERGRSVQDAA